MAERNNRVSEDVVEYFLFPPLSNTGTQRNVVEELEECSQDYLTSLSPLLIDIIWQNEGFKLKPIPETGSVPGHLHGETNFGENIEDEWFVVYLLYELTRRFPGLVARVHDSDEEFLLIEASDVLPKWLNPETAQNRVYIYRGELHIIPVPKSPAESAIFPAAIHSVGDAVECVRTYADQTRASQSVQTAINNRLKKFPSLMEEHTHYAHCYIPASIAAILDERPQLLAPAVRAFYYRDPIDLKCCRTFKYFRPGTRVIHRTRMTRCLYAQLVHQNFQPDKRSGWVIPTTSSLKFRSHDLGMKLAHGFEILCNKNDVEDPSSPDHEPGIPANNARWQKYVNSLHANNYFRGELEGSVLYKKLLENAWSFFRDNMTTSHRCDEVGSEVLRLLKALPIDVEERRRAEVNLQPPDDDAWLTLTPESLDELMQERSSNLRNDDEADGVFDLGKVADSMKTFVKHISSVDGAEIPGAIEEEEEDDDADIQFDGSGFISAMQDMFEFDDNESVSSSDMSEYGWEEDSDDETTPKTKPRPGKIKRPPSLDRYMDIMDRELAQTEVGKSFERHDKADSKKTEKPQQQQSKQSNRDIDDEDDEFQPVNIDVNTVKNLLESYSAQEGLAGPASNILGSMGIIIPPNEDASGDNKSNIKNGEPSAIQKSNNSKGFEKQKGTSSVSSAGKPSAPPRPSPPKRNSGKKPSRPPPPPRPAPRARIDSKETDV